MPVPGYDPDDLDEFLAERLSGRDVEQYLSDEELQRYEEGESLVDLLDDEDIRRLTEERDGSSGS